jgi:tRNA dimethylallyltransferase
MDKTKTLIVILGPTGIGKTDLSIEIAQLLDTEIISSDSRQLFKELKIGTAVPSNEQLSAIKHHLIGNKSIFDNYSAGKYEIDVLEILENIFKNKNYALLVGGSGMYIDAVCKGIDDLPDIDQEIRKNLCKRYDNEGIESLRFDLKRLDPECYSKTDLQNSKRILKALEICIQTGKTYSSFLKNSEKKRYFNIIKIGLERDRNELYDRIDKRIDIMLESGLLEEAKQFLEHKDLNSLNTVGYKELFPYFENNYSFDEAVRLIKRNSRHYAKRQITWFKRDKEIIWFNADDKEKIIHFIKENINI